MGPDHAMTIFYGICSGRSRIAERGRCMDEQVQQLATAPFYLMANNLQWKKIARDVPTAFLPWKHIAEEASGDLLCNWLAWLTCHAHTHC